MTVTYVQRVEAAREQATKVDLIQECLEKIITYFPCVVRSQPRFTHVCIPKKIREWISTARDPMVDRQLRDLETRWACFVLKDST